MLLWHKSPALYAFDSVNAFHTLPAPARHSFPGSAWERTAREALNRSTRWLAQSHLAGSSEAEPPRHGVPRRSLGTSCFHVPRSLGTSCFLVPRLCLETHCKRGSASQHLASRAARAGSEEAEPPRQCVPQSLLVPRLCLGTHRKRGSAWAARNRRWMACFRVAFYRSFCSTGCFAYGRA